MTRHDYSLPEVALTKWAMLTLVLAAVTSLALRYVTAPVTCHTPEHFTATQTAYAQRSCFLAQSIYKMSESELLPVKEGGGPATQFTYHHWLPFFLGVAAVLCLLPHVIWRMLSGLLWVDAHALLQTLADNQRQNGAGRHVMLHDSALLVQAGLKGGNCGVGVATLVRKAGCGAVCLLNVVLMAVVFSPRLELGVGGEGDEGNETISIPLPSGAFLCDYSLRTLVNVQRYTVQCVMPLAEVYSKGLTFFFYFFLVLFFLCGLDLVVWAGRLLIPGLRDVTLRRYVSAISQSDNDSQRPDSDHAQFFQNLGLDGRLLLALTADYCGPLAATDLTNHLWFLFKGTPRPDHAPSSSAGAAPGAAVSREGAGAIPMVTIGDKDGDGLTKDAEKEKPC